MAIGTNELQVQWSAANNKAITGVDSATSDTVTFSATNLQAQITIKADMTTGTPAAGDVVDFYLLGSCGDPDGAGTEEYATDEYDGHYLGQINVYSCYAADSRTSGVKTWNVPLPLLKAKLYAVTAGLDVTDVITVSACILEKRNT